MRLALSRVPVLVLGLLSMVPVSRACGGFFCNATSPVPIYQAGERVLFAKSGTKTIMHVEVAYEGSPTSFGWLLPLAGLPLGDDGKALPLNQALRLSHASVFDRVQTTTAPSFSVQNTFADAGCGIGAAVDVTSASDSPGGGSETPPVVVLQEAAVGPYAAQILQASDAAALFTWLNDNGYLQDEKARPLLEHYVGKGYVFLGLRLQTGKVAARHRAPQRRRNRRADARRERRESRRSARRSGHS